MANLRLTQGKWPSFASRRIEAGLQPSRLETVATSSKGSIESGKCVRLLMVNYISSGRCFQYSLQAIYLSPFIPMLTSDSRHDRNRHMARKTAATRQQTRDLMVAIPANVHKALKLYCVEHEVFAKDVVTDALRRFLKIEEKEE